MSGSRGCEPNGRTCPFCKREKFTAHWWSDGTLEGLRTQIVCDRCGVAGPTKISEKEAWVAWDKTIGRAKWDGPGR